MRPLFPTTLSNPFCPSQAQVFPLVSSPHPTFPRDLQEFQELVLLFGLPQPVPLLCHLVVQLFPLMIQALKSVLYVLLCIWVALQQLSPSLEWRQRPGPFC